MDVFLGAALGVVGVYLPPALIVAAGVGLVGASGALGGLGLSLLGQQGGYAGVTCLETACAPFIVP